MTVRNSKRMIVFVMSLMVLVTAANVFVSVWRGGVRQIDYIEIVTPIFLVIVFAGTWRRLSKLEAEHGPDFVQPTPPYARKLLIGAGILAAVLGGVAGYLIATR